MSNIAEYMKNASLVHENDDYVVLSGAFPDGMAMTISGLTFHTGYSVFNKSTLQMEYATLQLPDAIGTATQLHIMMKNKPWVVADEALSLFSEPEVNPDGSLIH